MYLQNLTKNAIFSHIKICKFEFKIKFPINRGFYQSIVNNLLNKQKIFVKIRKQIANFILFLLKISEQDNRKYQR